MSQSLNDQHNTNQDPTVIPMVEVGGDYPPSSTTPRVENFKTEETAGKDSNPAHDVNFVAQSHDGLSQESSHQEQDKTESSQQSDSTKTSENDDSNKKTWQESFNVKGEELLGKVKGLVKEGNVRRIIIKDKGGRTLVEFPLSIGLVGTILAPVLAGIGAIAALVTECTITIERREF